MLLAADYPFLDLMWTMLVFFLWVIWFWILISVLGDVFRRHDLSGWIKAIWTIFVILTPFLGVLIYLIINGKGMGERNVRSLQAAGAMGGPATEIATAKQLLDNGSISQEEFDAIKRKVTTA